MGLRSRKAPEEKPPAVAPAATAGGKKLIELNFKTFSSETMRGMAEATIKPLIEEKAREAAEEAAKWANPEVGQEMPDESVYVGESPDVKQQLFALAQDAGELKNYDDAEAYVKELNEKNVQGHSDWRLPKRGELNLMFNNKAKIPNLSINSRLLADWYWSSTPYGTNTVWCQRFSDGYEYGFRVDRLSVRAVRCALGAELRR